MDALLGRFINEPMVGPGMETVVFLHGAVPLAKVPRAKDTQLVALDIAASLALTAGRIPHKTPSSYPVPDSNARTVDFLNAWSCKPLLGGKNIKELLVHDGFSFWWCMEQWLYYSFLYRDPLNKIIEAVDVVQTVLKTERPKRIVYLDDGLLFSKVIPLAAQSTKAVLEPIAVRRAVSERIKETVRPWAIQEFFRWYSRGRRWAWRFERMRSRYQLPEKKGKHILAVCAYHWRMVEHPDLPKSVLGDPYITPIVEQLTGDTITYVDETIRENVGFGTLRAKARSGQRHILLEQHLTANGAREIRQAVRALRRVARELERSSAFRASWMYEHIDLWPLIAPQFRCYFQRRLENHALQYACAKALLEHEQPDIVLYPAEAGDHAYVFFKLCADKGIPSIGIQHGTMSYSPLTVHAREEMCSGKPQCLPRPTRLLLYGPYYRDFLVKNSSYPEDEIRIIGNLRFDHFAHARKLSKKAMAEKYGLDASKPIVMYLTQILPSPQESEQMTREVFRAVKELGLPLIVKQHPGEPSDALYHALAKEFGLQPLITKTASTLELLTASDVLIGAESTLDYEAMILDKPVIVMNFGERPDTLPFVSEGAALGVYKPEEVLPALTKTLFDAKTKAALAERMRDLVEAHCFKIDGKAAARAVEAIRELIA